MVHREITWGLKFDWYWNYLYIYLILESCRFKPNSLPNSIKFLSPSFIFESDPGVTHNWNFAPSLFLRIFTPEVKRNWIANCLNSAFLNKGWARGSQYGIFRRKVTVQIYHNTFFSFFFFNLILIFILETVGGVDWASTMPPWCKIILKLHDHIPIRLMMKAKIFVWMLIGLNHNALIF